MDACLRAWHDLSTCRQVGMSQGPIPFTAMLEWARFYRLDREATLLVWAVVRRLDRDHLERVASKGA